MQAESAARLAGRAGRRPRGVAAYQSKGTNSSASQRHSEPLARILSLPEPLQHTSATFLRSRAAKVFPVRELRLHSMYGKNR